VTTGTFS